MAKDEKKKTKDTKVSSNNNNNNKTTPEKNNNSKKVKTPEKETSPVIKTPEVQKIKENVNKAKEELDKAKAEAEKAKVDLDKAKENVDKAKVEAMEELKNAKMEAEKAKEEVEKAKEEVEVAKEEVNRAKQEVNNNDKDNSKEASKTKSKSPEKEIVKNQEVVEKKKEEEKKKHFDVVLKYFNGTGRAELSRLILAFAEIEFDDQRLDSAEWIALKPNTAFGQVPVLEYHGQTIYQSMAISRFLAKKTNLYGKDEFTQAKADAIVDYVGDYNLKWVNVFRANTLEARVEMIDGLFATFLPIFFQNLEAFLEKEGGKFFAGSEVTYADLCVFQALYAFNDPQDPFFVTLPYVDERLDALQHFPLLSQHQKTIYEFPGIKKYVDSRPLGLF